MKVIKVDVETCKNIEALQFEIESRKDVIAQVLAGGANMNNAMFEKYHKEYQDFHKKYNQAKQAMADTYLAAESGNSNWTLQFATCELIVEE